MTTNVFYSNSSDGYVYGYSGTYETARSTAFTSNNSDTVFDVGQQYTAPNYWCLEGFIRFVVSGLSGTVGSSRLSLYASAVDGGCPVRVARRDWGTTLENADWVAGGDLTGLTSEDEVDLVDASAGWYDLGLNAPVSGDTGFILWSSWHQQGYAPSAGELVVFDSAEGTNDPKLTIHTFTSGYPYIASYTTTVNASGTTHRYRYPSDIDAGDILLLSVANDGNRSWTVPATWSKLRGGNSGGAVDANWFYRYADGTETGNTADFTLSSGEPTVGVMLAIRGCNREFALTDNTPATGTSSTPNPSSGKVPKESRNRLVLAYAMWDHNDTFSSYPTNFTGIAGFSSGTGSGDCGTAAAYREVSGTSAEDPGTFGISGSEEWYAGTFDVYGDLSPVVGEMYTHDTITASTFGTTSYEKRCTAFTPHESCSIQKIAVYMKAINTPTDDVCIGLKTAYDASSNVVEATVDVTGSTFAWYEVTFSSPYAVTAGTTYWVSLSRTGSLDGTNYYQVGNGQAFTALKSYYYATSTWNLDIWSADTYQIRKTTASATSYPPFDYYPRSTLIRM